MSAAPQKLWEPSEEAIEHSRLTRYAAWLQRERGVEAPSYDELWRWSVDELEDFWASIWDYFEVEADGPERATRAERGDVAERPEEPPYESVLAERVMPGARWFEGARLSYAEHIFRGKADDEVAVVHASELRELSELRWGELRESVAEVAEGLRALGVGSGDRVVAYLPNGAEALIAFLATASLGAIWSSCSPDFGPSSVVDRFAQIEPKVLFAVDGYRYGGKDFDRRDTVAEIAARISSLERVVVVPYLTHSPDLSPLEEHDDVAAPMTWGQLRELGEGAPLRFERVPFDHPLWVLYSSGTTGLPKAIVQGHGGILLEQLKKLNLHVDAREGDRVFWFTTTGWMMWNFLVGALLTPASIVLYDGNPGHPDMGVLWDLAARTGVTCFGTSASYIAACMKDGVEPGDGRDLSRLRAVGSTGSPLSPEGFEWVYEHVGRDTWLFSTSGGTDVCTAFVGGVPTLPVYRGELQARALGAKVEAFDEDGNSVIDQVGELVITEPMPSMPVFFWGDEDGSRYRASYFEMFPGVWRHGDWIEITSRGTAIIYGRSDSTINRSGVRMGTSEIYRAVQSVPEVLDALVVDVPREGTEGWMPLFVVLREGGELDEELTKEIKRRIREACSPRHVPNEIHAIAAVPRTLSGKVLEVPVKRILMGEAPERAASRDSLANPEALDYFVRLAAAEAPPAAGGS
ncbi:MAG TPA: acetoacetate--CoA ligase [Solirubrobacterales bacterium]|nr:acetoacetate--CoA ligase [Solirubrobacterales bacterium]